MLLVVESNHSATAAALNLQRALLCPFHVDTFQEAASWVP